eukprot:2286821-Rhodomonas_salina.3
MPARDLGSGAQSRIQALRADNLELRELVEIDCAAQWSWTVGASFQQSKLQRPTCCMKLSASRPEKIVQRKEGAR